MDIVNSLRHALAEQIGPERFELWFEGVQFSIEPDLLRIITDKPFQVDRIRKKFLKDIRDVAATILGRERVVEIAVGTPDGEVPVKPVNSNEGREKNGKVEPSSASGKAGKASHASIDAKPSRAVRLLSDSTDRRGRRFQSLDAFVVGDCNRLSRTSADMVMQQLGEVSPLVIHGPTGVGKTHLVEGMWCQVRKTQPRCRTVYLSAEQFTTYFLEALKGSGLPSFRRKYRRVDLLIIDDIQFFAKKQATIVELASTIDEVLRDGRQIIMTADRPPSQLVELGAEFGARLNGGLVCSMQPLDPATQQAVLRKWARQRNINLPDSVIEQTSQRTNGDARQLSGVLNRLRATSESLSQPITVRMAEEILDELLPATIQMIRLQDIERVVCDAFGLSRSSLRADVRTRAVSRPRMLAMWLARKHTSAGLSEISEYFGRRSHSTVVSANKKVNGWLQAGTMLPLPNQSRSVHDVVRQLEANLKAG